MEKALSFEKLFKLDDSMKKKVKLVFHTRNDDEYTDDDHDAWALLQSDIMKEQQNAAISDNQKQDRWADMNWSCISKDLPIQHLIVFAQYLDYGNNYYVFGGYYVYDRTKEEKKLERNRDYDEYRGRLIVKRNGNFGQGYSFYYDTVKNKKTENGEDSLQIYALLPFDSGVGAFIGYDKVYLTHKQLSKIFESKDGAADWKKALSKVKAVYCITDTSNGELYIGSANSRNEAHSEKIISANSSSCKGLWGRWQYYANQKDLTGGNQYFNDIVSGEISEINVKTANGKIEKIKIIDGKEHIKNFFTYAVLEIFDIRTADSVVLAREEYWKKVFQSRKFGMNRN